MKKDNGAFEPMRKFLSLSSQIVVPIVAGISHVVVVPSYTNRCSREEIVKPFLFVFFLPWFFPWSNIFLFLVVFSFVRIVR